MKSLRLPPLADKNTVRSVGRYDSCYKTDYHLEVDKIPAKPPLRPTSVYRKHKPHTTRVFSKRFHTLVLPVCNVWTSKTTTVAPAQKVPIVYPHVHQKFSLNIVSNAQSSYKSHTDHPNFKNKPTRYASRSSKGPAVGIVPVTSMNELEQEEKLPEITGSRAGPRIGYVMNQSLTLDSALKDMEARVIASNETHRSQAWPKPSGKKMNYPLCNTKSNYLHGSSAQVEDTGGGGGGGSNTSSKARAEFFSLHSPCIRYKSHWVGPI